jgi:diguanylate cyclase (GGDEF)-like protein
MTQGATRQSRRAAELKPWSITAVLLIVSASLAVPIARHSTDLGSWWLLAVLFVAFLGGQAITLRLENRRQSMTASISEIPLIISLFLLPPFGVLVARLVAAAIVIIYQVRDKTKFAFNLAAITAATAVATTVVSQAGPLTPTEPRSWLVALAAVLAADMVTYIAVSAVITVVQGQMAPRALLRNAALLLIALVSAVVGLLLLLAVQVSAWSIPLMLALAAVFAFGYRAYARSLDQHRNMEHLYDLTQEVRGIQSEGELADVLLPRVGALLRAEFSTLWLPASGRYPELLLTAQEGRKGLLDRAEVPLRLRERVAAGDHTLAVGPKMGDDAAREMLRASRVADAILVPLRSGNATIGCLAVANRLGDSKYFGPDDVKLLETLAAHTAVAVENSRLVARLRFDAYHDAVTGLPNRHRMLAALEEAVRIRAPGEVVALMMFDVDDLREVNDSLGHVAGDKLLTEVGRRLSENAPAGALVGRVGGDEFGLSLRISSAEAAVELARTLRRKLQDPMPFGTKVRLDVDTAVGIAIHPDHGSDPEALLQRADVATIAAKSTESAVQLFNLGLESRSVRRLGLAGDLRRAIDAGELEVYFQPKIHIQRQELVGVECLARWKHPAHGWVAPEDFVAVAEHTGQLGRLTDLVLREGLLRCRDWAAEGHPFTVAVNLSPRTLVDPGFPAHLSQLIAEYGVAPELVTLEITEHGVIADTDRPLPTLRRLRDIGVRLSVDDFGTGYSSLSYLRQLPVQEVKIDRTFVQGMATDQGDLAIVRAVVDLSRHFGLEVVAEGVESELALSQLAEIGCDVGQGFYFSRPLSYERLEAWLSARTELVPPSAGSTGATETRRLRIAP